MKFKKGIKIALLSVAILVIGILILGNINALFGWYGYEKWKYRVSTNDINESKKSGVFIKEVHFEIDSFPGKIENFRAYIEHGFHYGHESEFETLPWTKSDYPYQLSFNFPLSSTIVIFTDTSRLNSSDSANFFRIYLKFPRLTDTVVFNIEGEHSQTGIIKIWD
jgi:hypothetical protein